MLDHVVCSAIDPGTPVVPILLDQPQHQTIHLGFARCGRNLGLRAHQCQGQECEAYSEPEDKLPFASIHHSFPSVLVITRVGPEPWHPLPISSCQ
jgi:hypothetical protein